VKKVLLIALGLLISVSTMAGQYSLVENSWKLAPLAGTTVDKSWLAYDFNDGSWLSQPMPGQWQQVPEFKGKYNGNMVYRCKFDFKPAPGRAYYLRFNGVFYRCNVWLNGYYLGRHAGYFAPFEWDVTSQLRDRNILVAEVICPREKGSAGKIQITGVFGYWDLISHSLNPGGIWQPVEIVETGNARLSNVWLGTEMIQDNDAKIILSGDLRSLSTAKETYKIAIDLEPDNFSGKPFHLEFGMTAEPGENHFQKDFRLEKPELWNTWDRGKPNLYKVSVKAVLAGKVQDETAFSTGIRTIEKRCQKGQKSQGLCWQFVLNGKPIYIRGNNYAPSDALLAAARPEDIRKKVDMMRASYYNMVRVHAHIDRPEFYDAMDRAGIMIFQDFPLQWGYNPSIFEDAKKQAREMVFLLGSHPSIAIWSCHNEPPVTGWNPKTLDPALKKLIEQTDPTRPVNLASGVINKTDAHSYFGWYQLQVDNFKKLGFSPLFKNWLAFSTEFGAQAFPNYDDAIKFMAPDIAKIDWKKLETDNMLQYKIMTKYVPIRPGMDLKTYINATQEYQARLLKYHIDLFRSVKYNLNYGVIPFVFNDPQPDIVWSVVDYWGEPKKGYFEIQQAFQPVCAFPIWQFKPYKKGKKINLPIFVVNDLLEEYEGVVKVEVTSNGKLVAHENFAPDIFPDMPAGRIGEIPIEFKNAGDYIVKISLELKGMDRPIENTTVLKVVGK
jgi:beta-mannosidase